MAMSGDLLAVMTQVCYWHSLGRGQRCAISYGAQDSPTAKNCLMQKLRGTEVEQPCFPGSVLERALGGRSIFSGWQVKLLAGVAELGLYHMHCWSPQRHRY